VDALETLERSGGSQISGTQETPMPLLSAEGIGQLSLTVPPPQVLELIATAAERAPYGRGDQTIVDEGVRKFCDSRVFIDEWLDSGVTGGWILGKSRDIVSRAGVLLFRSRKPPSRLGKYSLARLRTVLFEP